MYHINHKGEATPCKARVGKCPFGKEDAHYSTLSEAKEQAELRNEKNYGLLSNVLDAKEKKRAEIRRKTIAAVRHYQTLVNKSEHYKYIQDLYMQSKGLESNFWNRRALTEREIEEFIDEHIELARKEEKNN